MSINDSPTRARARWIVPMAIIAVAAVAALALMSLTSTSSGNAAAAASTASSTPSPTASPSPSPSPSPSASAASETGDTTVVGPDGSLETIPFVSGGSPIGDGNTVNSTDMPALSKLLPDCGILETWQSLVDCVTKNGAQWYIDGVNRYEPYTGFNWSDVLKWAAAKTAKGNVPEARVIFLTGSKVNLTDAEAQAAVSGLVGADVAQTLQVVRFTGAAFMNTWRTIGPEFMTHFADYKSEVRVSLTPLVLNDDGTVKGLNSQFQFSGVFVDCYNDHGIYRVVAVTPKQAPVCPAGTALAGQPIPATGLTACTPPTVVPPTTHRRPTVVPPRVHRPTVVPPKTGGKHAAQAPAPDRAIVPAPKGGYVDRSGASHKTPYTPPASTVPPAEVGHGDSGSGATNTVTTPKTSAPAAQAPITKAPVVVPVEP